MHSNLEAGGLFNTAVARCVHKSCQLVRAMNGDEHISLLRSSAQHTGHPAQRVRNYRHLISGAFFCTFITHSKGASLWYTRYYKNESGPGYRMFQITTFAVFLSFLRQILGQNTYSTVPTRRQLTLLPFPAFSQFFFSNLSLNFIQNCGN